MFRIKIKLIIGLVIGSSMISAQSTDHLYCIHNPAPGNFHFATMNLNSGIVLDVDSIPIVGISLFASSTIDRNNDLYHLCTTTEIYSFDLYGNDPYVVTPLPLAPGATFFSIEYDPCDSSFIGIHNNYPNSVEVVRLRQNTNAFQTIHSFTGFTAFCAGCQGMFDPVNRVYMMKNSSGIFGVDVQTGNVIYQHWIQDPIGFTLIDHLAYDCLSDKILGTSLAIDSNGVAGKYLGEVNPVDGVVTVLTSLPTMNGIVKPALGSSCIDPTNGQFYWSGNQGLISGASTTDGTMNFIQPTNSPELLLIEHYSGCHCKTTGFQGQTGSNEMVIYPNPVTDILNVISIPIKSEIRILDSIGNIVVSLISDSDRCSINVSGLSSGLYLLEVNRQGLDRFIVKRK